MFDQQVLVGGGTSMAAPHVAGAFAALKSAVPTATVADIELALRIFSAACGMKEDGGAASCCRFIGSS